MILIFEDNLLWSTRLLKSLQGLGYEAKAVTTIPDKTDAKLAIVNLGSENMRRQVPDLVAKGIHVIGHAGHKEKDLLQLGRDAGCQTLATNSELTYKIETLVKNAGF